MPHRLKKLAVRNFRSLADIDLTTDSVNVLFGPNGAGKSSFLDSVWFIRDCAIRGVDLASAARSHGIGTLWDGADEGSNISIALETDLSRYEVAFGYSSGRIEPFVGEKLESKRINCSLIDRKIGSDKASFYHYNTEQAGSWPLKEPEKLALNLYVTFQEKSVEAEEIDHILRYAHLFSSRGFSLPALKRFGSESGYQVWLDYQCRNLWSVLRNLHDRKGLDDRYETIIEFMRKCFPAFKDLLIEQTGPNSVYGSFVEKSLRQPIAASGVSDGHLQMLILLTALFGEGRSRESLILFDEPETSLHPHALAVLAEAIKLAAKSWEKQVFLATHSPVLLSQFDPEHVIEAEVDDRGRTVLRRLSEIPDIENLLEEYSTGSLYMAEEIGPQRPALREKTS